MFRMFAVLAALVLTTISISSAGFAGTSADDIRFTLEPARTVGKVQLSLRSGRNGHTNNMSSHSYVPTELAGLDFAALRSNSSMQVRFALVREPGRIDCSGNGGNGMARGRCSFTASPAFADLLSSRGIARPDRDESYALMMVGADRALVDAIGAARFPTPTIDDLTSLAAVGVTPAYINELSRRQLLPQALDDLVQFAAVGVTPDYVDALAQAGYRNLPADSLVEFRALDISPAYAASLASAGYANLPPDELVELKALEITPEFIRSFARLGYRNLAVDTLVQLKALDVTPEFVAALRNDVWAQAR